MRFILLGLVVASLFFFAWSIDISLQFKSNNLYVKCESVSCPEGQVCTELVVVQKRICHMLSKKSTSLCYYKYYTSECYKKESVPCGTKCSDNEVCRATLMSPNFAGNKLSDLTEYEEKIVSCRHKKKLLLK
jgi:hypothetical protein